MEENSNESGHTFGEVVGVTLFILIFAILIILAYYMMIDKNKASTLIKKSIERAVVVVGQIQSGHNPSLADFEKDDVREGRFLPMVEVDEMEFKVILMNVEQDICVQMKSILGKNSPLRRIEGECGGTLYLVFNKDFTNTDFKAQEDLSCEGIICPDYAPCQRGQCLCPQRENGHPIYHSDINLCCDAEYAYDPNTQTWGENVDCLY